MQKYEFQIVPKVDKRLTFFLGKYRVSLYRKFRSVLSFDLCPGVDAWYPEREALYVLSWLAMELHGGVRLFGETKRAIPKSVSSPRAKIDGITISRIQIDFDNVVSLCRPQAIRLMRACYIRNTGFLNMGMPEIAYVLLVTALESASNPGVAHVDSLDFVKKEVRNRFPAKRKMLRQSEINSLLKHICLDYNRDYGVRRRVAKFVGTHTSGAQPHKAEAMKLAKEAYNLRSTFVHEGTNIEKGIKLADRLGKKYIRHGKGTISPGLNAMLKIIDECLNAYPQNKKGTQNPQLIHELAVEDQIIMLTTRKAIPAHSFIVGNEWERTFILD